VNGFGFVDFKLMDFYLVGATSEFYSLQMSQLKQMQHSYNTCFITNGLLLFKIGACKSSLNRLGNYLKSKIFFHMLKCRTRQ